MNTWKYSRELNSQTKKIELSENISIGGETNNTVVIAGPCSIESEEQIDLVAQFLKSKNISFLRAGAFKPRTNPYSFMGLGLDGLLLLKEIGKKYDLKIITEARDSSHIDMIIQNSDIIQIGAKAMWDYGIMEAVGNSNKPVLLKRSFGARVQELAQIAEFIMNYGNENVILCERGIRSFETSTRFTLDLCGVSWLKKNTNLPIVLDPSHAMGFSYGIPDLARACVAMGVDGLMIETHPNPQEAKSDSEQQLNFKEFSELYDSLLPISKAVKRFIV